MRFYSSFLVLFVPSQGLAQEACTRELILARDQELPVVSTLPPADNLISSFEDLFDCSFHSIEPNSKKLANVPLFVMTRNSRSQDSQSQQLKLIKLARPILP